MRPTALIAAVLLATAIAVVAAPRSNAARNQLSVIEDSARMLSVDPALQDASLDEMSDLDADVVKIPVIWRNVAPRPDSKRRPSGDLSDPDTYGPAAWSVIDRAILGAGLRHKQVWLMLTVPAPRWAVRREDPEAPGATQPNPKDFANFAQAAGSHFAAVKMWSILNEPNLSLFLRPQFKNGVAVSAIHYRKVYRAGEAALRASGHRSDKIFFGELLPRAPQPRRANGTVPPLMWLRDFFCLGTDLKPLTGAAARSRDCGDYKPIRTDGFAYHPYTTPRGPMIDDDRADSATIQHLGRVYAVLDAAYRYNRTSARRMKIYSSEFGFQSDPPDPDGVSLRRIPEFLNVSEYLSFKDPRVATYSQYLLRDDTAVTAYQSGLSYADGKPKPGVYAAYRLPVVVVRRSDDSVVVWGRVRNGTTTVKTVTVESAAGGGFETVGNLPVNRRTGYFEGAIQGVDADGATFRVTAGTYSSRKSKAGTAPKSMP